LTPRGKPSGKRRGKFALLKSIRESRGKGKGGDFFQGGMPGTTERKAHAETSEKNQHGLRGWGGAEGTTSKRGGKPGSKKTKDAAGFEGKKASPELVLHFKIKVGSARPLSGGNLIEVQDTPWKRGKKKSGCALMTAKKKNLLNRKEKKTLCFSAGGKKP